MDARKRVGPADRPCRAQGAAGGLLPRGDGQKRRERRLQRARARDRAGLARRRADPHHLAVLAPDPRALFAGLHVGDAAQACRHCRADRGAVPGALRSASRRLAGRARRARSRNLGRDRNRIAGGRKPRRGPHPAPLRQRGHGRDPHQFLSARPRRARQGTDRDQICQPQGRRHAAAAAALRDLRLFAARRSRASALRQGGARRHSLVRPAAGFPHRDPRPGQGAERQERRDRAGRRQGRLRAEISAGRRFARSDPGRRHRHLQDVHLDAARHHRQYRHRNGRA